MRTARYYGITTANHVMTAQIDEKDVFRSSYLSFTEPQLSYDERNGTVCADVLGRWSGDENAENRKKYNLLRVKDVLSVDDEILTHFVYGDEAWLQRYKIGVAQLAALRKGDNTWKSQGSDGSALLSIGRYHTVIIPRDEPVNILVAYSVIPDLYKLYLTPKLKGKLLEWLDEEEPVLLARCGMTAERIAEIKGERKPKIAGKKSRNASDVVIQPDGKFVSKDDLDKIFNGRSQSGRKWSDIEKKMFLDANDRMEDEYGSAPDGMVYSPRFIKRNL